jgi:hypothetical protein
MRKRLWIGLAAVVIGGAWAARRYMMSRPVTFYFEGEAFVHHPDGSFSGPQGAPVISPQLEAVRAHWESLNG